MAFVQTIRHIFCTQHLLSYFSCHPNVQAAADIGIPTLPPVLTEDLSNDPAFLEALNHILFHVHLVQGMLTCPVTAREFPVQNGIPNMMLEEEECETVRF